jgi:hypothetical protein
VLRQTLGYELVFRVSIGLDRKDSRQVLALRAEEPGGQGGGHDDDEADDETPTVCCVSILKW